MAELTPLFMDISSVYSGDELGLPYRDIIGEGVVGAGDLEVTERGAGADLSVDVAAGAVWVLGDTSADSQPIYRCRNDAVVNLGISPDPSNPRIVLIIARVTDETFAGTGREWELQALHGTPAGSPSAPALPDSAYQLASIAVDAGATSIVDGDITDSRAQAEVGGGNLAAGGSEKVVQIKVIHDLTVLTTGDGKAIFVVSDDLNGMNLVDADAFVTTNSSSGTPTIQVRNVTQAADMLSTRITIDANEPTSYTAAAQPVIDTGNDDVATGDLIAIDVDVAGTGAKGLGVVLTFA